MHKNKISIRIEIEDLRSDDKKHNLKFLMQNCKIVYFFFLQRGINLSIISPRKIPALQKLYEEVIMCIFMIS
jgi:hypothetical protein